MSRRRRYGLHCTADILTVLFAVAALSSLAPAARAQCSRQPVISGVDPPSGSSQTHFTVLGDNLDTPSSISVIQDLGGANILANNMNVTESSITFAVIFAVIPSNLSVALNSLATFAVDPDEESCETVSIEIFVVFIDSFVQLRGGFQTVQPGTVLATSRACLPPTCGDNSTGYEVVLADKTLEELQATSLSFVVRVPDTNVDRDNSELSIQTFYSLLSTNTRVNYRRSPPINGISPSRGQRGTRVVISPIEGESLIGFGFGDIVLSRVLVGSSDAEIDTDRSNETHIYARVSSGTPGSSAISINTTQTISGTDYEGPYTYSDSLWTQLEDGVVSELVPPAAQINSSVRICGERLLGGGSNIASITIAGEEVGYFGRVLSAGDSLECIDITVPEVSNPESVESGGVTVESDTGAIVESENGVSFTYAVVTDVTPSQGQVGTEVTISGVGLLSGYPGTQPTVSLAGVEATVVSSSPETIVVRAQDPNDLFFSGSGSSGPLNSTGDVVITVAPDDTEFSVSLSESWEYLESGVIQLVQPYFGQFGTRITLSGTNLLGYGSGLREVLVGGSLAGVVSESNSVVVIDAPDIGNLGRVDIVMESENGALVELEDEFEYRERGVISGLDPAFGQNGTFVLISGSNLFGHARNITSVTFGDLQAEIDYSNTNNSLVRVRVRSSDVSVDTDVRVVITAETMARVASSGSDWTYLVPGRVGDVRPNTGQNGTVVTITGTSLLGGGTSVQSILLDGVRAAVTETTSTSITVAMDDFSNQTEFYRGTVHIVANTRAVVVGGAYTHRVSGVITGVSPTTGREGTRITITGTNLPGYGDQVTRVIIAGVAGEIVNRDSDTVVVVRAGGAPSGTQGRITLVSDTGAVIVSPADLLFTYTQQGTITNVSPSEGAEGSGVLIQGVSLRPAETVVTSVTIGGSPVLRVVTESENEVAVVVGPAPESGGIGSIIVITANDGSIVGGGNFTYLNLTLSLPGLNWGQQGTMVTVRLPDDSAFNQSLPLVTRIGGQVAEEVSSSVADRTVVVVTPRAGDVGSYTVDVTVEGIDGRVARLRNGFTYIEEGVIFSATPSGGQRGTRISVRGRNLLGGGTFIESAYIGERGGVTVSANVTDSNNDNVELEILENLPSDSAFPVTADISLTADTGASVVGVGLFSLVRPGEIERVSPTMGQLGTRVTISGTGLLEGGAEDDVASVSLAGREVLEIVGTPSDIEIIVRANSSSEEVSGPVIITLTTGAEIITPDDILFQYLPPGVIESVSPGVGTVGTIVEISGSNLLAGGTVQEIRLGGQVAQISTTAPTESQILVAAGSPSEGVNASGVVEIFIDTGAVISGGQWDFEELGVIQGVSPTEGQQGVTVTVGGTSLLGSSGERFTSCSLAGVAGAVSGSSDNQATCVAGFNTFATNTSNPAQLSGPVQLVVDSGPVISTVISSDIQFTYYPAVIEEVDPTNGTNGTYVDITGLNLIGSVETGNSVVSSVVFGAIPVLSTESVSRERVRVRVGPSEATSDLTVRLELESGVFLELEEGWSYTEPGDISSVSPTAAQPGRNVTITGVNLVPPCVSEVTVIIGQTRAYEAEILSSSEISFRPGPYQASVGSDSNLDSPGAPLPIQVIAGNGATIYTDSVLFTYSESDARVSEITPHAGSGGTEVTIRGTNLLHSSTTAAAVVLAGRNATVLQASDTEVVVIAGEGPTDGSSGRVLIESDEGLVSGIGTDIWTYLPVITADDVSPQTGQNGTQISIDLRGITLVISRILLAGVSANVVDASGTRISVVALPSEQTSVGDIDISFEDGVDLTIPSAWSYLEPPRVDTLSPNRGYFNTEVRIQGGGLRGGSVSTVTVGGLDTEIISEGDLEIVARVSEFRDSSAGEIEGGVVIIWDDGATYTNDGVMFTYVRLEVRGVSPRQGQGGTIVSITGVGLLAGSSSSQPLQGAELGGVAIQETLELSDTRIDLVAGASGEGVVSGDVTYTVGGGGRVVIEGAWQYLEPGEFSDVSPVMGVQGSYVTIRGEGMLQGGASVSTVTVAGVEVMEVVIGLDDIIAVRLGLTPALPQGVITIVTDTGSTLTNSTIFFQYITGGSVTFINSSSGQNGTRLDILGVGFTSFGDVERVTIAGVEASVDEVNDTLLTIEVGRPDILEELSGQVLIETESGVIITGDPVFTYTREGVVYSGSPSRGQVGTRVVISGERLFGGGTGIDRAYLAGVEAVVDTSVSNDSSVSVIASAPAASATTGDIVLVADTGAYVRKIDAWTYVVAGEVLNIDPPQGQFGTRIRITGIRLLSGGDSISRITVGNALTTDITFSSESTVNARMGEPPTPDSFTDTINLISNYGGELGSSFTWTYLEASNISSASPSSGVGGDIVVVTGERLLGGGSSVAMVTTAGVPAFRIDSSSNNENVTISVGYHPDGSAITGDIVIESDTGALTVLEDGWSYDSACPEGQFGSFGNCTNCSAECVTCDGPSNEDCFQCRNFAIPLSDLGNRCVERCPNVSTLERVCVDVCESNQYSRTDSEQDAVFCYDCSELCDARLGCSGPDPTECAGCETARDRETRACVAACDVGTWLSEERECVPCDSQCNATAGCFGGTNSDCYQCLNVEISSEFFSSDGGSGGSVGPSDICVEICPTDFYENSDGRCLPCSDQCIGGCGGPTTFDCSECASFARSEAGTEVCVASCNSGMSQKTLFESGNGSCGVCSRLCSLEEGCTGPADSDCIRCRLNRTTNATLPRFGAACVLACPNTTVSDTPTPDRFYYHNTMTGTCELCDVSCRNGCRGSSAADCLEGESEKSRTFSAGPGTIGVTVAIVFILAVALVVLVVVIVVFLVRRGRGGYKMSSIDRREGVEMETRYARRPNNTASPLPPKESTGLPQEGGTVSADDDYTQMFSTHPIAPSLKRLSQQPVDDKQYRRVNTQNSSITTIENQDAVYSEAGPEAPDIPPRPTKPTTAQPVATKPTAAKPTTTKPTAAKKSAEEKSKSTTGKGRKVSEDRKSLTLPPPILPQRPPVTSPAKPGSEKPTEKKKPALPPPAEAEGEMYTEMTGNVQQVYIQPAGEGEEYTAMAHVSPDIEEMVYEDTLSNEPISPQKSSTDTTPLIDDLYEDTDLMMMSSDYQRLKHSMSSSVLPANPTPSGLKPLPRSRSSTPLPQTPLEISLQGSKPAAIPEDVYVEKESPPTEESLYEAITTHHQPLPDEPPPEMAPKERARKGSVDPPLPPKGRK